jgi:hypothetical protein
MKSYLKIFSLLLVFCVQSALGQVIDRPKPSLILQISQEEGTNGSGVAYNPIKQLYYTIIAGNTDYPLEVFDGNGNSTFQTSAGVDMRGIWWNAKTNSLEGNSYGEGSIVSYVMNESSFPDGGAQTVTTARDFQPLEQAVGVYDAKKKAVVYYSDGYVYWYSRSKGTLAKKLKLDIGANKEDFNNYSIIYTGVKNMELGLLDYNNKVVYLFSAKSGKSTASIILPSNAVTFNAFRFAYANKQVFLYDIDARSWTAYKIFN